MLWQLWISASKHIRDIGEVNQIAKKTMVHSSLVRQTSDYKSSSNNCRYSQHGRKPFLSLRSHSEASTKQSSPHLHGTEKQDINFQVHTPPKPMLMLVINCITLTTGINSRVTLRSWRLSLVITWNLFHFPCNPHHQNYHPSVKGRKCSLIWRLSNYYLKELLGGLPLVQRNSFEIFS